MSIPARVAAAAVISVLAIGGAFYVTRPGQPAVGGPRATSDASLIPSQPAVLGPSATPTATPSPTPTPLLWTQASQKEDWPAPVRAEPAGGAVVLPISLRATGDPKEWSRHADPVGDTGSDAHPWVDIQEFVLCGSFCLGFTLVSNQPPVVDPTEQWIAYGVVVDDDGDGVPDRRFGMDNIPFVAAGQDQGRRQWMTDFHTGRTVVAAASSDSLGGSFFSTSYPPGYRTDADFNFGGGVTGGGTMGKLPERFYIWASVIQGGRVVASDYAPDVGWLEPGSTPQVESSPSPGPTPRVVDDPDVPGGRLWTVTVFNESPRPATLVVAEETEAGLAGRPVGTVTPSVVPAGAAVEVIIALPPAGSRGWAIFVTTGPNTGGGINWFDAPAAGEFRIGADGNAGWRSLIP